MQQQQHQLVSMQAFTSQKSLLSIPIELGSTQALLSRQELQQSITRLREDGLFLAEEVQALLADSSTALTRLGKLMGCKQRVLCTAIIYFKRFFLCSDKACVFSTFDPRLIRAVCLFVACKTEECGVHVRDLVDTVNKHRGRTETKLTIEQVLSCESWLVYMLTPAQLEVKHAFSALTRLVADLKHKTAVLLGTAWEFLNDSYRTDVCVLYRPTVVAAAALYMAAVFHKQNVSTYLRDHIGDVTAMEAVVASIRALYTQTSNTDAVASLYHRLAVV